MEKDWIKIRAYANTIKAEMDKQLLEEHGVPAILLNKQDSSLKFGGIELYVKEATGQEALSILAEFDQQGEEE
ncbi:DUF2007 domain-containing protein [Sphingobacterium sp. SGG-5]|uniref:putative signal transducing protein n=1 Tax=Sphingobacterium sp. SGG-5 TaxID=2710881 RepID=UPI0013EA584F|nr:DUF2007 domain-containing protein [Sphingobacterium sp. SGG-5]NGM60995.1 DUF2007 domain-containing protein [Sphingobacterium sp. SGG-5]